jgi:Leucine-rich repeat (LRR) protein
VWKMGSTSSRNGAAPKSRKTIEAKLGTALKTGVLSLKDIDLKASSSVWGKIASSGLIERLKTLDISGNTLKTLPPEIYDMMNLKTLHCSRCNVQYTHDLSALMRLQTIHLDNNDLESNVLASLPTTLVKLDISNNHLATIPTSAFVGLVNMRELNLSGNRLNTIEGVGVLTGLVDLCLDDNQLQELSLDLAMCVELSHVSVKNNQLSARSSTREGEQSIPQAVRSSSCVFLYSLPSLSHDMT